MSHKSPTYVSRHARHACVSSPGSRVMGSLFRMQCNEFLNYVSLQKR